MFSILVRLLMLLLLLPCLPTLPAATKQILVITPIESIATRMPILNTIFIVLALMEHLLYRLAVVIVR
jgi:hypothetical protein